MNSRFSGSNGFGSWFGNEPSGSKKHVTASIGRCSRTGGSIAPAIPLAASITTLSGATHDLHAGVFLRVVRRRDGDTAVEGELADREIDHLGSDQPEVEHLGALVGGAAHHRGCHLRARKPHVPADGDQ